MAKLPGKKEISLLLGLLIIAMFLLLIISIVRISVFGEVEGEKHIYFEIVFLLLLAICGEIAVVYTKQPNVMILMVLGILMSPSFIEIGWNLIGSFNILPLPAEPPDIFRLDEVIHVFAQLGAVILLFKVGMHNKLEKIFSMDKIVVALAGVIVPFAVGYLYASMTGGNFAYSMFMAAALTATSVGVTVAILKEYKLVKRKFAEIIIGAAVLDDILGLLVLSFVVNMTGFEASESLVASLLTTGITAAIFIIGSVLVGKYIVKFLDKKEMSQRRFLFVLALMLFYAYVAEFIQLSAIVGAFMAGIILNNSRHKQEIEEKSYGLEMLFMPIFFISLGMMMDVNALVDAFVPIIIITVIATLSKVIACGGASLIVKLKKIESAIVGFGMSPRGEVALIVGSIGLTKGILTASEYSIIASMAILTTIIVPPILKKLIDIEDSKKEIKDHAIGA